MDEPVTSAELREQAPLALVPLAAVQTDSGARSHRQDRQCNCEDRQESGHQSNPLKIAGTYEMILALRSFGKAIVRQRLGSTGHTQYMHAEVISTVNMSTSNSFSKLSPNRSSHLS